MRQPLHLSSTTYLEDVKDQAFNCGGLLHLVQVPGGAATLRCCAMLPSIHCALFVLQCITKPNPYLEASLLRFKAHCVFEPAYSRLSPISQTSNTPSSGMPLFASAVFRRRGGSRTSSHVNTHVPQCMPSACLHFVSVKMLTLSNGFACIGDIMQRGS